MNDLTIINKMMKELQLAKSKSDSREELMQHIRHVKLLSELFLEDESPVRNVEPKKNQGFSEQEIKAMLGEKATYEPAKKQQVKWDDDHANGDSIFDF